MQKALSIVFRERTQRISENSAQILSYLNSYAIKPTQIHVQRQREVQVIDLDVKTFDSEIERFVKSSLQIEAGSADPYNTMRIIAESWFQVHLSEAFFY